MTDKGITRLSRDPGAAPNPLDALVDAVADKIVEKLSETPRQQSAPEGIQWLTMKEVAQKLKIDYSTINKATNSGELPYHSILGRKRINPAELDEWVKEICRRDSPKTL